MISLLIKKTNILKIISILFTLMGLFLFFNGCAMANKSVLPDKKDVIYALVENCEKAENLTIYEQMIGSELYLDEYETDKLFELLNKSLISIGKEITDKSPEYKITFLDTNKETLIKVYIKDKDVVLLKKQDDTIIGEYSILEDFYKEFNSVLLGKEFS